MRDTLTVCHPSGHCVHVNSTGGIWKNRAETVRRAARNTTPKGPRFLDRRKTEVERRDTLTMRDNRDERIREIEKACFGQKGEEKRAEGKERKSGRRLLWPEQQG